jgi:8-oxo-dGTP diphosphatase
MKAASIGLIFDKNYSRILLLKRRDFPLWVPPGGGVESHETPEQAVCREVLEETGLEVYVVRHIGTWLPINRLGAPSHLFECLPTSDLVDDFAKIAPNNESLAAHFFSLRHLPHPFFFLHREYLEAALCHLPNPVLVKMTNVTYCAALRLFLRFPWTFCRYLLSRFGLSINS